MRQNAERAGDFEIVPCFDFVKRVGHPLVSFLQLPAQRRPFFLRNGFRFPTVLPINHYEFFAHIIAQKFEIKPDVFAMCRNRRASICDGTRRFFGVNFINRIEKPRPRVQIHRPESRVRAFESFLQKREQRMRKICLIDCFHIIVIGKSV